MQYTTVLTSYLVMDVTENGINTYVCEVSDETRPVGYVAEKGKPARMVNCHPIRFTAEYEWLNKFNLSIGKTSKETWTIIEPVTGIYVAEGESKNAALYHFWLRLRRLNLNQEKFSAGIARRKTFLESHRVAIAEQLKMMRLNAA